MKLFFITWLCNYYYLLLFLYLDYFFFILGYVIKFKLKLNLLFIFVLIYFCIYLILFIQSLKTVAISPHAYHFIGFIHLLVVILILANF